MMKIYIEREPLFFNEIKYVFEIFAKYIGFDYILEFDPSVADYRIGSTSLNDVYVSKDFYIKLHQGHYNHKLYFSDKLIISDQNGIDLLSTAFYMLSCIQELDSSDLDEFGRFKYFNSYQFKFSNIHVSIVSDLFDRLYLDKFSNISKKQFRSKIFLSHDIDTVKGSLFQDGFYAIKKLNPFSFFSIAYHHLFLQTGWLNIDRIMKIESEYEFTSTFYWLVNQGIGRYGIRNSDYSINSKIILGFINDIDNSGSWENGLHKSTMDSTITEEIDKLPVKVVGNRYHYLNFTIKDDFPLIEKAGLKLDASLGFADAPGFRNSFSQPFQPYDLSSRRKFNFVEVPLHQMDTTYFNYLKLDANEFTKEVIKFVEGNSSNSIVSLLFHNNFISEYKYGSYLMAFKNLLCYFYENNFKCITQKEIIKSYLDEYQN